MIKRTLIALLVVFVLSPSLHALTPVQVSELNTAYQFVYKAYGRALSVLPESVSSTVQKRLSIWAYDPQGRSSYGSLSGSTDISALPSAMGSNYNNSPFVNSIVQSGCAGVPGGWSSGPVEWYCDKTNFTRGLQSLAGDCTISNSYLYPTTMGGSNSCTPRQSCLIKSSGWTSTAYLSWHYSDPVYAFDAIVSGNYHSISATYSNSCSPVVTLSGDSFIQLPIGQDFDDTVSVRSAIQRALNLPNPVFSGFTETENNATFPDGDKPDFVQALNILDHGVSVASGQLPVAVAPAPSLVFESTGVYTGGSSIYNTTVTVQNNISFSTIEIVGELHDLNSFLKSTGAVDYAAGSSRVNTLFDNFQAQISSIPVVAFMYTILPPSTSDSWEPCLDFRAAWTGPIFNVMAPGETGQFCFSRFGAAWFTLVGIIRFSFVLVVMVWGFKYIWGGY